MQSSCTAVVASDKCLAICVACKRKEHQLIAAMSLTCVARYLCMYVRCADQTTHIIKTNCQHQVSARQSSTYLRCNLNVHPTCWQPRILLMPMSDRVLGAWHPQGRRCKSGGHLGRAQFEWHGRRSCRMWGMWGPVLVASFIAFHANAPLLPFDLLWLQKPWRV